MNTDGYYNFWQNTNISLALQLVSFPLFLIFIKPLYQFAKSRNPMLLIYSKSIAMGVVLFITPIGFALNIISIYPSWWLYVLYVNSVPYFAVRFHLLAMALNRFYSVYFPFKYEKLNKRMLIKICIALWIIAIILTPLTLYVGMNQITMFPFNLIWRQNIEQICIYSACLLYLLMAAKLIWIKFHIYGDLEGSFQEKDYYKISAVCIVSVLPFLLGILSLKLMQTFIAAGIYQNNHLLQDVLITFNVPFLNVANFSEEICLLLLSADFRAIVKFNLIQNANRFLKIITLGRFTMESINPANNENDQVNNNANESNTISNNNIMVRKCPILTKIRRNNRVEMAPAQPAN